jgi:hypothetical protein
VKTRVFITIDVECSEERPFAGVVRPPIDYELRVWGRFENQSRELGIGLIMDVLEASKLRATFFVEVLGAAFFGEDRLAEVCRGITARGHDVQLHVHPILRQADWHSQGIEPPVDDIGAYSTDEQVAMLREGLDILERCDVPRDQVHAFRAGNYGADNRTWSAMKQVGLTVSSNYNASYLGDSCRIDWPTRENALFDTGEGVLELPISNFVEPSGRLRHLQLSAVSTGEMIHYIEQAPALGVQEVTIVTHSFEFFHLDSVAARKARPNRLNIARLEKLCRYLRDRSDQVEVRTVASLATEAVAPSKAPGPLPRGARLPRWRRIVEQAVKRVESAMVLSSR